MKLFGSGDISVNVRAHCEGRNDLAGKLVVDVPAGKGYMSALLRRRGAEVEPLDLFPEFFKAEGLECRKADLSAELPVPSPHADLVLCQEGIEHLPDQLKALREFNRILKAGGTLILTTPNDSSLRAKVSRLLVESELFNRLPANELDGVWFSETSEGEFYYGHLFLAGIQRLRILGKLAGFRISRILPVKASRSSILLGVLLPLVALTNLHAYARTLKRHREADRGWKRSILREIVRFNLNPEVLFGKHLFLEMTKERELGEVGPLFSV